MTLVPKRNTWKSFERPAKILRRLQIFGKNLGVVAGSGAGAALTLVLGL